ncbi:hypothetical protein F5887DRAFT_972925 [Amanita rubescens]|nr:hypothetical protein F5887DRAFT_972925 [Amanita rubescens]
MSAMTTIEHDAGVHHIEFEAPIIWNHRPIQIQIQLPPNPKRDSLDPHVLAHIIMQLRHSLAEMTKERDELVKALSAALTKEAELNDALQLVADKATGMEEELAEARKKTREDEEAITMLRSKVEESRRGLMRLQTESRRQSGNLEFTRGAFLASAGSPPTSKRASFAPLTGSLHHGRPSGHRRISSVSDTGVLGQSLPTDLPGTSPKAQDFPTLDAPPSRRVSGIFGRQSPPHHMEYSQPHDDSLVIEMESLKKELQVVRNELDNTKHELAESNEAREASETCARALREFIADNNIGVRELDGGPSVIKLPPPPATTTGEEAAETQKAMSSSGWGFGKLWRADHGARTPSVTSVTSFSFPVVSAAPQTPQLGSFFSPRSTTSSSAFPVTGGGGNAPNLQSNAASTSTSHRGSIHSFSDASSITEPVSPSGEQNGAAVTITTSLEPSEPIAELEYVQGASSKDEQVRDEGPTVIVR